jgi:hypothetical protein
MLFVNNRTVILVRMDARARKVDESGIHGGLDSLAPIACAERACILTIIKFLSPFSVVVNSEQVISG